LRTVKRLRNCVRRGSVVKESLERSVPLFHTKGYDTVGRIIGGDTHLDPISLDNLDTVFLHTPRQNPSYGDIIITLDFHGSSTEDPGYDTFQLYEILSAQNTPFRMPLHASPGRFL